MSVDAIDAQKVRVRSEIDRLLARPDARSALTVKLAQAQVLAEETEQTLRPSVEFLAAQAGEDPAEAWSEIAEFPAWCVAQLEQALAAIDDAAEDPDAAHGETRA